MPCFIISHTDSPGSLSLFIRPTHLKLTMENNQAPEQVSEMSFSIGRRESDDLASVALTSGEDASSDTDSMTIFARNESARASHPTLNDAETDRPTTNLTVTQEMQLLSEETLIADSSTVVEISDKRPHTSRLRRLHWWWFWELGGITLSVSCMIAILILLPYLDDLSLNDWHFLMAPNTMISTCITVAKTSMLLSVAEGISQSKWQYFKKSGTPLRELDIFDGASRGPWGALMFLRHMMTKRRALLAMLGAFVVIASLTMEPFAQQILSYETRPLESDQETASFSIVREWNDTMAG